MECKKKKYKSYDALKLAFEASPICMVLHVILPVTQSIMQTAETAVSTANFVDTAMAVLSHTRPYRDIYPALALVLLTLGLVNTLGAAAQLGYRIIVMDAGRVVQSIFAKYVEKSTNCTMLVESGNIVIYNKLISAVRYSAREEKTTEHRL